MSQRPIAAALAAICWMAASAVGCANNTPGDCTDQCPSESTVRCFGALIQTCTAGSDGCLGWIDNIDCASLGQTCVQSGAAASCGGGCTPGCALAGESRCSGQVIQTCAIGAGGCLEWTAGTDCAASGLFCDDGSGPAVCTDTCASTCTSEGDTQCLGDIVQTCTPGANDCLYWVDTENCAVASESCVEQGGSASCSGSCADECPGAGDTQCLSTVIQTCTAGADGCLDWVSGVDCAGTGELCDDSGGAATCVASCPTLPSTPAQPSPADGASAVDWATVTTLDWADSLAATGYAVYFGTSCSPPGYPDPAFTPVTASELPGLSLTENTDYCWQVVALASPACYVVGPLWSFHTACTDPVPGPPAVTSPTLMAYPAGTTSGTYTLTFSEAVSSVATNVTWAPVSGSGTAAVVPVDAQTFDVVFSGVADGDHYTLTVQTGVLDPCGNHLPAPVVVTIAIDAGPGSSCTDPYDVSAETFPFQLNGTFDVDPPTGASCDTTPHNAVWLTYTAPASGWFVIDTVNNTTNTLADSRLAVLEGTTCSPLGAELACTTSYDRTAHALVSLTQGAAYTILFYTNGDTYPMVDPTLSIRPADPGEVCSAPIDLTGATFPHQTTGTFAEDPPSGGPSCDTTPNNAIWYTFTPTATDWYVIDVVNHTTNTAADSRLAVFEGTSCTAQGAAGGLELDCASSADRTAHQSLYLTAGTSYLILHYTSGDTYPMVDPEITIGLLGPGEACGETIDLTTVSLPHQVLGTFVEDPPSGSPSCDTSPTNAIWFRYTPPTTDWYQLEAVNHTTNTSADTRLAVFEGTTCTGLGAPGGVELRCTTSTTRDVSTGVYLTAGTEYLIVLYTQSDTYPMVDPEIDIHLFDPGMICTEAVDLTGATFPHSLAGTFPEDPPTGGPSCDTTPNNAVWYTYTAPATDWYVIDVVNQTTNVGADSRLAIYEGTSCTGMGAPAGIELECAYSLDRTAHQAVLLTAGTSYLILHYTSGDTYPMQDPQITIGLLGPGEACGEAVDVSGATFPFQLTGDFVEDPPAGSPSCDTSPTNAVWFSYTPTETRWYAIDAVNATTNTSTDGRVAVFAGTGCTGLGGAAGAEVSCTSSTTKDVAAGAYLTAGTGYLIAFFTQSDTYPMVDPQIDIHPFAPGQICSEAEDVTGATFPYQLTGTFAQDPPAGGPSCDTSPTNAAWFTFTAPTTGWYAFDGVNATTNTSADSRLAIFEGTTCTAQGGPGGTELACGTSLTRDVTVGAYLTAGQTYLILLYTQSDTYPMESPSLAVHAFDPGQICSEAEDVTGATFPVQLTGTFPMDPPAGSPSCDTSPTNAVWFAYTPAVTQWYAIEATNNTTNTLADSRLAVFDGATCTGQGGPAGVELECAVSSDRDVATGVELTAGVDYLILLYTQSDSYPLEDPSLDIRPFTAGEICEGAVNLTGATFPYQLTGTFDYELSAGGSCDTTPNNAVWFTYTPASSGAYQIDVQNHTATTAYSRLAVFQTAACSPFGAQLDCVTTTTKTASTTVSLTAGTTYLILFYTSSDTYLMVDPEITIQ